MDTASKIQYSKYKIRSNEVNLNHEIKIPALVQLMQETSLRNIIRLKIFNWNDENQRFSWILNRKKIEVFQLPKLSEEITVKTYPSGFDKYIAYRDFFVYDKNGKLLAQANSTWTLIDRVKRKIVKIPEAIFEVSYSDENTLPRLNAEAIKLVDPIKLESYKPQKFDLDWNQHVNNNFFIKILLDALPASFTRINELKVLSIIFRKEALLGDELHVLADFSEDAVLFQINSLSENRPLLLAKTLWREINAQY